MNRVLYFIFNNGHGVGGHFHSLDSISKVMSESCTVGIVSVGSKISPVFSDNPAFITHVQYDRLWNAIGFLKKLNQQIKRFDPDVLHFFDSDSLLLAAPLLTFSKRKIIFNKCGGSNPLGKSWVYAPTIIFFSKENYNWFSASKYYSGVKFYLIPNRVFVPAAGHENKNPEKESGKFSVVRVARIGKYYLDTIKGSIELTCILNRILPTKFILIGRIQEKDVFDDIFEYALANNVELEVIYDERANNASAFLYLADVVVGTGRSAMEAMACGKPVFAPVKNLLLPVLVTNENFNIFFNTNFSKRTVLSDKEIATGNDALKMIASDSTYYETVSDFGKQMFNQHFDIASAPAAYLGVYENATPLNNFKIGMKNIAYIFKTFFTV